MSTLKNELVSFFMELKDDFLTYVTPNTKIERFIIAKLGHYLQMFDLYQDNSIVCLEHKIYNNTNTRADLTITDKNSNIISVIEGKFYYSYDFSTYEKARSNYLKSDDDWDRLLNNVKTTEEYEGFIIIGAAHIGSKAESWVPNYKDQNKAIEKMGSLEKLWDASQKNMEQVLNEQKSEFYKCSSYLGDIHSIPIQLLTYIIPTKINGKINRNN